MNNPEICATRKEWKLTTWADGYGIWYAKISSPTGWGNAGIHNIELHFAAMKARARRAITREINMRQHPICPLVKVEVWENDGAANNVTYSITFKEKV